VRETAYFNCVLIDVNVSFRFVPMPPTNDPKRDRGGDDAIFDCSRASFIRQEQV
jgi:hypothetical protein